MISVSKNVLQLICDQLHINDAGSLKMVCKYFNNAIEIVCIKMYSCAVDKHNLPLNAKHNCLKVTSRFLKHKLMFQTLKNEFYSDGYKLFAVVLWGQLKTKRQEDFNNRNIAKDFISTTILTQEKISFINEGRKVVWKLNNTYDKLNVRHVQYIQKELRFIQEECWLFPYSHTTALELKNSFEQLNLTGKPIIGDLTSLTEDNSSCRFLVLRCAAGDVFTKTIDALDNLLTVFNFKLPVRL